MKFKEFKVPLYFGTIQVIKTDDLTKLNPEFDLKIDKGLEALVFRHVQDNGYIIYVVAFEKGTKDRTIAHEIVHLVNHIFIDRGIDLDRYNDEPQAYLTGFLFSKIKKTLKSKGKWKRYSKTTTLKS